MLVHQRVVITRWYPNSGKDEESHTSEQSQTVFFPKCCPILRQVGVHITPISREGLLWFIILITMVNGVVYL